MNKTTAKLIGLIFTDGCLSPKGVNSWRFYFSNKSQQLVLIFKESMMQEFALQKDRIRLGMTSDGLYRAIVDSKEAGQLFTERFGTFRTLRYKNGKLPKTHLPIKELIKHNVVKEFLQSAFSCDGGVSLYVARRKTKNDEAKWLIRGVYLACAHPKLRKEYILLLKSLGITACDAGDGKVKIRDKKNMEKFCQKVGFIDGVHITHTSKFWPNIEKQKLLEQVIDSYRNPKETYSLQQFILR
jgi:hypothetical protein